MPSKTTFRSWECSGFVERWKEYPIRSKIHLLGRRALAMEAGPGGGGCPGLASLCSVYVRYTSRVAGWQESGWGGDAKMRWW
jgi:hypothetical protein